MILASVSPVRGIFSTSSLFSLSLGAINKSLYQSFRVSFDLFFAFVSVERKKSLKRAQIWSFMSCNFRNTRHSVNSSELVNLSWFRLGRWFYYFSSCFLREPTFTEAVNYRGNLSSFASQMFFACCFCWKFLISGRSELGYFAPSIANSCIRNETWAGVRIWTASAPSMGLAETSQLWVASFCNTSNVQFYEVKDRLFQKSL